MSLLLRTHYKLALSSLRRNRTRSFLTCLGIAIGVASIILILSLMGSITSLITSQIKNAGADLIIVRPTSHKDTVTSVVDELTSSNQFLRSSLTLSDVDTIMGIDTVAAAAPITNSINTLTSDADHVVNSASVIGTTTDFNQIQDLSLRVGSFLSANFSRQNTAVIGSSLASALFGTAEPVGQTFSLLGQRFIVIGVLEESDDPINFNNIDLNYAALIDINRLKLYDANLQVQQINVRTTTTSAVAATADQIDRALAATKYGDHNFSVTYGDQITHPAGSLFSIISAMLTLVASISLIVGGIGVMNIMLVSVSERTHEIGIRKAVGASTVNILLQFMFEALVLSILGGLLGFLLGYCLAFLIALVTPFNPYINWQIVAVTVGTSVAIGTVFGLYPAIKAAHQSPIDSLRHFR